MVAARFHQTFDKSRRHRKIIVGVDDDQHSVTIYPKARTLARRQRSSERDLTSTARCAAEMLELIGYLYPLRLHEPGYARGIRVAPGVYE
jgi:hypothetical protein